MLRSSVIQFLIARGSSAVIATRSLARDVPATNTGRISNRNRATSSELDFDVTISSAFPVARSTLNLKVENIRGTDAAGGIRRVTVGLLGDPSAFVRTNDMSKYEFNAVIQYAERDYIQIFVETTNSSAAIKYIAIASKVLLAADSGMLAYPSHDTDNSIEVGIAVPLANNRRQTHPTLSLIHI